jgi:GtrA-like protein.
MVGLVQLLVDWLLFVLLSFLAFPVVLANVSGRVSGALLGFWLNGKITFRTATEGKLNKTNLIRFIVLWFATTIVSTVVVYFADAWQGLYLAWLIKPVIDGTLALCGFIVSRCWVYRSGDRFQDTGVSKNGSRKVR